MNIFILPSWYPSGDSPYSGVFFREQAMVYGRHFPEDKLAISHWGPNDHRLLLEIKSLYQWPNKLIGFKKIQPQTTRISPHCTEYFNPSLTWSRRIFHGNLNQIIAVSQYTFELFSEQYGAPDVIQAHVAFPGGFVARELSKKFNVPYVITEHMSPFPMPGVKWNFEKYVLEPLKTANKVVAVSKSLSDEMKSYGVESEVISNFIDDQFFVPEKTERKSGTHFRFLCVGRLEEQKGQEYLIRASQLLKRQEGRFEVKIVGDGSLFDKLKHMISENELTDCVELLGPRSKPEIKTEIQHCDAFVFPSLHESFGIAPLEALASGKPVIGTAKGEVSEMINTTTGISILPKDVQGMVDAMNQVIRNKEHYDPEQIRSFYEKNYASSLATSKLRQLYEALIKIG